MRHEDFRSGTCIDYAGRISKQGDTNVRGALCEAAAGLLMRSRGWSALKAWGMRIVKRTSMMCAIVAVARKLPPQPILSFVHPPDERGSCACDQAEKDKAVERWVIAQIRDDPVLLFRAEGALVLVERRAPVRRIERTGMVGTVTSYSARKAAVRKGADRRPVARFRDAEAPRFHKLRLAGKDDVDEALRSRCLKPFDIHRLEVAAI